VYTTWKKATPLVVTDTITQVANFKLQSHFHFLHRYAVSENVTDALGNPVKRAWAIFANGEFNFDSSKEDQNEWPESDNYRDFFRSMYQEKHSDRNFQLGRCLHVLTWDARNQNGEMLPTGICLYRLSTLNLPAVKKMLLLK
jgi:hypothetical protein